MLILIAGKALNPNWVLLTQEKLIKCTLVLGRLLLRGRDYNPKRVVKIETYFLTGIQFNLYFMRIKIPQCGHLS